MKRLFTLLMVILVVEAQSEVIKIDFKGTGASASVDSVRVEDVTHPESLSLNGDDTLNLSVIAGINEISNNVINSLKIYPNPMRDYCMIEFNATEAGETSIGLYDLEGRRTAEIQEQLTKGEQKYRVSGLRSGVYIVRIESANSQSKWSGKILCSNFQAGMAEIMHVSSSQTNVQNNSAGIFSTGILKKSNTLVNMQCQPGDILRLTGYSSLYGNVVMLVPTVSQTVTFNFSACKDANNNNYKTIQIGTQTWMAENLRTTKYSNGSAINHVADSTSWTGLSLSIGAYCWYDNDSAKYNKDYGALYNWAAVNTQNLCPSGWHVPSQSEWMTLINYSGGGSEAGGAMKESGTTHWYIPNTGATNSSGFTALPGGQRNYYDGSFTGMSNEANFWSSTQGSTADAWCCYLYSGTQYANMEDYYKLYGYSVRCIKNSK